MISKSSDRHGYLVAIGGAEDKTSELEVLSRVIALAPAGNNEVAVIAAASGVPDDVLSAYEGVFTRLGAKRVHLLPARSREGVDSPQNIAAVEHCGVVFFTGGDQMRLTNTLCQTRLLATIRARFDAGAVVAGTSAGAAALSATMICNGRAADALHKNEVTVRPGMGFIDGVIIDSHFLERGRFTRLMEVGASNPQDLGVGLGEDAAVIVHPNRLLEAVGPGHVIVVDSRDLAHSNIAQLGSGEAVAVENIVMHALIAGHGFAIDERRYLWPATLDTYTARMQSA